MNPSATIQNRRHVFTSPRLPRLRRVLLVAPLIAGLLGCASNFPPVPFTENNSTLGTGVRSSLGTIAVSSVTAEPQVEILTPGKVSTTMNGIFEGALEGGAVGGGQSYRCYYLAIVCAIVFPPVFAIIGGAHGAGVGAREAVPEATQTQFKAWIEKNLAGRNLTARIRDHFITLAQGSTRFRFVRFEDQPSTSSAMPVGYSPTAGGGVSTVMEISDLKAGWTAPSFAWSGGRTGNLLLRFYMTARVRLIRATDGEELGVRTVKYEGKGRAKLFEQWSRDDAFLFRREVDIAYKELGKKLVNVFGGKVRAHPRGDQIAMSRRGASRYKRVDWRKEWLAVKAFNERLEAQASECPAFFLPTRCELWKVSGSRPGRPKKTILMDPLHSLRRPGNR